MTGNPIIHAAGICKEFPLGRSFLWKSKRILKAVDRVSFDIQKGETLGLVGESGCGKSTLGRILLHLISLTGGIVEYQGRDISKLDKVHQHELKKEMQLIFQNPYSSLNPRMNAGELVEEPLEIYRIGTKKERYEAAEELLHTVGIEKEQLKRYPHEFSGGQRQRIDIARALILHPHFVVCDEPVSALDVSVRASVLNLMKQLQVDMGLTYLFISHDLSVVRFISDRVAVMYLGHIVEIADTEELYRHPLHPYTQMLLQSVLLVGKKTKQYFKPLAGEVPSPYFPPTGCPFHDRCPFASGQCRQARPKLQNVASGHQVACWMQDIGK